ncbi:sugar ABC transporter substrate-binding protein [Arthrobacter sp. H5]|uniref:ABC transporter substrate-binding protein n=1 Tax=Arthrobacter sp. H5 TaxID=1267973 RepID=UPI000483BC29|nr:sugar ABC transporter substrate-binding protein [Arthrobacter sp. H5]
MTGPSRSAGRRRRGLAGVALATAAAAGLAGCGGGPASTPGSTAIDYWLWDSVQLPGYTKCANAFEAENPDIDVRITQYGWDDYWSKLTASFVAESGPDVFTNHVSKYPEFVQRGVLLPLESLEATASVDPAEFQPGLAEIWQGPDGSQYGMPKDFDTVGLFYDQATLDEAGLAQADLQDLTWNPDDGGTFEELLARLTVDANGIRGDEPGFDPDNVEVYGLASGGSGGYNGQTQWSWLVGSTGWTFNNQDTWGNEYNFDDPRFKDTMEWYFGLVDKGFLPPFGIVGANPNASQQVGAGTAALAADGSWMIRVYNGLEGVDMGITKVPAGPSGKPSSMYNGLGDSISAQSENPEDAARWVHFLGSDKCQVIIGKEGTVFPARPAGTEAAMETFEAQGIDPTAFTDLVENDNTLLFPVTDHGATITSIMQPVMDELYIGTEDVSVLDEINSKVNALFE